MNMRYAHSGTIRIEPQPGAVGTCQICGNEVKAYCGKINKWHWRHNKLPDCDSFYEPMTEWHKNWQNQFPKDWQEVVLERNNKKHFADIFTPKGLVIEFQNSSISSEKIIERELFYNHMIWVVNAVTFNKNLVLTDLLKKHAEILREKFNITILTRKISEQVDFEISSIQSEILSLEGQQIRNPRNIERKKSTLETYEKTLQNLDEYLLNTALVSWLKNGRILYAYSENFDMNEVEIRQQIIDLQLEGNTPREKLEILINETDKKNSLKKKSLQEIYKVVKSIFLEGLPKLIEKEKSEIEKIELGLPKLNEEYISLKLKLESLKRSKKSRISVLLVEKKIEFDLELNAIIKEDGDIFLYEWKQERRSWKSASRLIFLDLGDEYLFEIMPNNLLKRTSKTYFINNYSSM